MTQLNSADLEFMRSTIEELLPDTCDILTATLTIDGQGGLTESWGTVTAGVACRLDVAKQGYERIDGAALLPYSYWWLTVPHDTAIATGQRVLHSGQTYNVEFEDSEKSWPVSVRVAVTRV